MTEFGRQLRYFGGEFLMLFLIGFAWQMIYLVVCELVDAVRKTDREENLVRPAR